MSVFDLMGLGKNIYLGVAMIGLIGMIGGCKHNGSLRDKRADIDRRPVMMECNQLSSKLFSLTNFAYHAVKTSRESTNGWQKLQRDYDRYTELETDPSFVSSLNERNNHLRQTGYTSGVTFFSFLLTMAGALGYAHSTDKKLLTRGL